MINGIENKIKTQVLCIFWPLLFTIGSNPVGCTGIRVGQAAFKGSWTLFHQASVSPVLLQACHVSAWLIDNN